MTLLEQIASDRQHYRKRKHDSPENALYATLLTTLYGEVVKVGKDAGNRDTTDEESIKVIQRFIKGLDEIEKYQTLSVSSVLERDKYKQYLPQELSESTMKDYINSYFPDADMRMMKNIMNEMKKAYPNKIINGKVVRDVIKQAMTT